MGLHPGWGLPLLRTAAGGVIESGVRDGAPSAVVGLRCGIAGGAKGCQARGCRRFCNAPLQWSTAQPAPPRPAPLQQGSASASRCLSSPCPASVRRCAGTRGILLGHPHLAAQRHHGTPRQAGFKHFVLGDVVRIAIGITVIGAVLNLGLGVRTLQGGGAATIRMSRGGCVVGHSHIAADNRRVAGRW